MAGAAATLSGVSKRDLYLMRHATADDAHSAGDHERALTSRGRSEASSAGTRLAHTGLDQVLCSTAVRAVQTFEALHAQLGANPEVRFDRTLYLAPARTLLETICMLDDEVTSVLVIAHNPGVSELAWNLAQGSPVAAQFERGMRPAALAHYEVASPDWYSASPVEIHAQAFWSP